jgi:hypothetical protein
MTDVQARNREQLAAVRVRRDRLYEAILELERVLAVPAGDRPKEWAVAVGGAVDGLRSILERHVADTEADGGFFDDVRDRAPQLLPAAKRLQAEHAPLLDATIALATKVSSVGSERGVDAARADAVDLIQRLLHHRHRGAELVYDAYSVDISAAD